MYVYVQNRLYTMKVPSVIKMGGGWKRKTVSLLVVALLFPVATVALEGCVEPPEDADLHKEEKRSFSVATWNLEWLFSADTRAHLAPDQTEEEAELKVQRVAAVMEEEDVDIWVLTEVEDCDILNRTLHANDGGLYNRGHRRFLVPGRDFATRQQTGLVTRIPPKTEIKRTDNRVDFPDELSRCGYNVELGLRSSQVTKHLYTVVDVPPFGEILIVGVHFRAFPNDPRPCAQREAQAKVISQIVKENSHAEVTNYDGIGQADVCSDQVEMEREFPYHLLNITWTREAIVLGDFNDLDPRIPDRNNNIPRSRTLEIMRETGLRSVGKFTEQKDRWTWGDKGSEDPRESMIDHIFVSPGLFEKLESVNITWTDEIVDLSDHTRVIARFNYSMPSRELTSGTADVCSRAKPESKLAEMCACTVSNTTSKNSTTEEEGCAENLSAASSSANKVSISSAALAGSIIAAIIAGALVALVVTLSVTRKSCSSVSPSPSNGRRQTGETGQTNPVSKAKAGQYSV